jgi:hypothetical protein
MSSRAPGDDSLAPGAAKRVVEHHSPGDTPKTVVGVTYKRQ